ncbi:MAG: ATP-binding protein [Chloroflexota bacterium]|nr:ATP-binding protein [Chloroflexota bacterium]
MARQLQPSDVFTPNRFPLEEHNVYAARTKAEADLGSAIGRNQVPVVYGEYGVGKTTLVKKYFHEEEAAGRFVHVLNPANKNIDDVAKVVLEAIGYRVEVSRETSTGSAVEGSVEAGVFAALKAKLSGELTESESRREELLVTSPTDQGFLKVLADAEITIAIDEMHKSSDGFRLQLADLIKAASNQGLPYPRIVVLGTTADAEELVRQDEGVDRLVREVRVEPMIDDESRFVVTEGMQRLGLGISGSDTETIIRTAAGAPALLQEICLDVAEHAVKAGRDHITRDDIGASVRAFLLNSQARLTQRYMTVIETVGPRRYRKQILRAMAESANDFVTMDELTQTISKNLREDVPATALSGPLRELKKLEYGEILRDVSRPSSDGTRVYNLTAFKDPRMKAFIRAMHAVEAQGMLPTGDEVAGLSSADDSY